MEGSCLLISDVDGTLLGDDEALKQFACWHASERHSVRLVYNSGRFPESVAASVASTALPEPDAIIGGVGTEICLWPMRTRLRDWPKLRGRWDAGLIRQQLLQRPELELQPELFQSEFKVSFFGHQLSQGYLAQLQAELAAARWHVDLIYSSGRDLDVLPAEINKGAAAVELADRWGLSSGCVIVCGDSGNDLTMFQQDFRGVVVGNGHPELRSLARGVYQASGHYAWGVLEGVGYWLRR